MGGHPAVQDVRLVGSRAQGRAHELSDWDLYVRADDFPSLADELESLLRPLEPLAQQWDPYADHPAYMLMFAGPTKVDLCFFDEPHEWAPPYEVRPETLAAIDGHFWDWILWLEQKQKGGHPAKAAESLERMWELMLRPMGVPERPETIAGALDAYLEARDRLEREFGIRVPRALETEVRPVIAR